MIKTKQELVTVEGSIWATPKYNPEKGEFPFQYELKDGVHHWSNNAILVAKVQLSALVPEGIDLYQMAMETLTHKENEAMRVYSEAMMNIAAVRKTLLLLNAPTPAPAEGEYIPAPSLDVPADDEGIPL
jgi:hypothetical protein